METSTYILVFWQQSNYFGHEYVPICSKHLNAMQFLRKGKRRYLAEIVSIALARALVFAYPRIITINIQTHHPAIEDLLEVI